MNVSVSAPSTEVHERSEQFWKMGTRSIDEPSVTKVSPYIVVVSHNVSLGNMSVSLKFQKVWADTVAGTASNKASNIHKDGKCFVRFIVFMELNKLINNDFIVSKLQNKSPP